MGMESKDYFGWIGKERKIGVGEEERYYRKGFS